VQRTTYAQIPAGMNPSAKTPTFCAEPEAQVWLGGIVRGATDMALEAFGETVAAVLVVGGLSRGEASVLRDDGRLCLLGDVDMLLVLRRPTDWRRARKLALDIGRRATRDLGDDARAATIDYGLTHTEHLRSGIRPSIFAFDLRQHGIVTWGDPDLLVRMPSIDASGIPRDDALRLVMNRILEWLLLGRSGIASEDGGPRRAYRVVKIVLDVAGAALAFAGEYEPLYARREAALARLLRSNDSLRQAIGSPEAFMRALALAVRAKVRPGGELLAQAGSPEFIEAALGWAEAIWTWQMRTVSGLEGAGFRELVDRYLAGESPLQRMIGWAKFYRHPLRPNDAPGPLGMGRRLFVASPQRLTYAAALLLHGGLRRQRSDWMREADALLPASAGPSADFLRRLDETWNWLVRFN
jgi:hypothetical protein